MVTGDVVNTAARIQAAAPVGAVAVGAATFRQTEREFEYEPLAPVGAKGKAEPLPLWRALAPRARLGSDVIGRIERVTGRRLDVIREGAQKGDMRDTFADTSAARRDLGFRSTVGLDEGLAREWEWIRGQA